MDASASNLARELLQHEDFLKRLARGLVGAEADDLVQDVWARALAHPPAELAQPRAWLARIARNLAANRGRSEERRLAREERAAASEVLPDASADVEQRFELRRRVVQALDELSEPFRGTLILRYFEELSLEAIALRQGVPLATAKSRHLRALEKLRAALDARCGKREEWLGALAGWLRAGEKAGEGSAVAAAGRSVPGRVIRLLSAGGLLAVIGAVAAVLFVTFTTPERVPAETSRIEPSESLSGRLQDPALPSSARTGLPSAAIAADPSAVHGTVLDDVGSPVTRFRAVAEHAWFGASFDLSPPGKTTTLEVRDENGRFELAGLEAGEWDLHVETEDGQKSERTRVEVPGDGAALDFLLVRPAILAGTVLDPAGRAVAGAKVVYALEGLGPTRELEVTTDSGGRFARFAVPPGPIYLHASAGDWAPSEVLGLRVPPAEQRDDLVLTLRRAARLVCDVLDRNGRPDPGREVRVSGPLFSHNLTADEHGRFELEALAPGKYSLSTEPTHEELSAPEFDERARWGDRTKWLTRTLAVELGPGASEQVVLGGVRPALVRIGGTIRRAGLPFADVSIKARPASTVAFSAADGSYAIETESSGRLQLELWDPGGSYWICEREVPANGAQLDFDLPAGEVGGRIVGADGRALAKVDVSLYEERDGAPPSDGTCAGFTRTEEDGQFRFRCVRPGLYHLKADQYGGPHAPLERSLDVAEGSVTELELDLALAGRITGTVRGPGGKICPLPDLLAFARGVRSTGMSRKTGDYSFECLVPGTYRVLARTQDGASELSEPIEVKSGETVALDLTLVPGTLVRARAVDAQGEPVEARISILDAGDREFVWRLSVGRGMGTIPATSVRLPRGEYRVTAWDDDERNVSVPLRIVGQREEDVPLVFDRR
jgi:RNA polymerase sigma-70 factor (ECF subfamily)